MGSWLFDITHPFDLLGVLVPDSCFIGNCTPTSKEMEFDDVPRINTMDVYDNGMTPRVTRWTWGTSFTQFRAAAWRLTTIVVPI